MGSSFASSSVSIHLARGVFGIGAAALSLYLFGSGTGLGVASGAALSIAALILLRGCPMCWTVGLFETIAASIAFRRARTPQRVASRLEAARPVPVSPQAPAG